MTYDEAYRWFVPGRDSQFLAKGLVSLHDGWGTADDGRAEAERLGREHGVGAGDRCVGCIGVGRVMEGEHGGGVVEQVVVALAMTSNVRFRQGT